MSNPLSKFLKYLGISFFFLAFVLCLEYLMFGGDDFMCEAVLNASQDQKAIEYLSEWMGRAPQNQEVVEALGRFGSLEYFQDMKAFESLGIKWEDFGMKKEDARIQVNIEDSKGDTYAILNQFGSISFMQGRNMLVIKAVGSHSFGIKNLQSLRKKYISDDGKIMVICDQ